MDAAPAQWLSSQAPRPGNDKSYRRVKGYLAGLGAGVGEGHSFLVPQPPQLAWAMGAERVAMAMMSPARAKRSEVMFGVLGWLFCCWRHEMLVISWVGISMTASEQGCSMDFQKNPHMGIRLTGIRLCPAGRHRAVESITHESLPPISRVFRVEIIALEIIAIGEGHFTQRTQRPQRRTEGSCGSLLLNPWRSWRPLREISTHFRCSQRLSASE